MFDIGGPEFVFLILLALIVFGPKRLPEMARTLGTQTAKFRAAWLEFRRTLERETALGDIERAGRDVKRAVGEARGVVESIARVEPLRESAPKDDEATSTPNLEAEETPRKDEADPDVPREGGA